MARPPTRTCCATRLTSTCRRNNVEVLEEQPRQTRDRFNVGEVTRTDVAQAEARLALARSGSASAKMNLRGSIARFRQVVGVEPRQLAPGRPLDRLVPTTVENAIFAGLHEHPSIHAALHALDAAEAQVKITEGELHPSVGVRGSAQQRWDNTVPGDERFVGSVVATLNVPLYEGGEVYARVRQAKETAGQRRMEADIARDIRARQRHHRLGAARGREGADHLLAGPGPGGRGRADRRARGGPGRPAHDA